MAQDAANLLTIPFFTEPKEIIILPASRNRTYIEVRAVAVPEESDVRVWFGPGLPNFDLDTWLPLIDGAGRGLRFDQGLYGPIILIERNEGGAKFVCISVLPEDQDALAVTGIDNLRALLATDAEITTLTTDSGDVLTTDSGAPLIYV